ncbi:sigma-54-dependent transcriptional regulator [Geotalea uraniireducens]|uniref:Two component, sigma54 specific, transcriptional regulator, Fis family n=1 Tax=Geotalea uraniireducens (strain Rf4) TaxID=351605 RepID=A5GA86_GEOUR|nr:sigma-54 dependent transcriptional regulator [Geotalea uraniireducens]ABQ25514.1 two component, sigma54 specific, transcriptional regulator, Fis family [Geotalea uraniireducens Rf4]
MSENLYPPFGILLVDDEPAWILSLSVSLERCAGITNIITCTDSREVIKTIERQEIGLVILDLVMPHLGGEEVLALIREQHPEITTIVISGMNQLETAVRCMKMGAFDYYVKTDDEDRLINGVMRAISMIELKRENREMSNRILDGSLKHPKAFAGIVTTNRAMHAIFAYIEAVAQSPQPLLISGESGVGKEQIAQAAHVLSGCRGPLVAVNVAGLDDSVFADTLFGHVRGAFTGAEQARRGMVEEAADGTLFLDEIGDLSIPSQVKLLRLLQEGEYFPLGSDRPKRIKARVIVATHQDLAAKQSAGTFRRDLYYRLCTHHIQVPPLRERQEDIPLLLDHFLKEAAGALGKKKPTPPKELVQLLATYKFPGNVRELRAMVYDAVSIHRDRILSMESFLKAIDRQDGQRIELLSPPQRHNLFGGIERLPTFSEAADLLVTEAMSRANGNQSIAARLLGITQSALCKRLKRVK